MKKLLKLNKTSLFIMVFVTLFVLATFLTYTITYFNNVPKPFDLNENKFEKMILVNKKSKNIYNYKDFPFLVDIKTINDLKNDKLELELKLTKTNESTNISNIRVEIETNIFWKKDYKDSTTTTYTKELVKDSDEDDEKNRFLNIILNLTHDYPAKPIFGVSIKKPNIYIKITYDVKNNNETKTDILYLKIKQ